MKKPNETLDLLDSRKTTNKFKRTCKAPKSKERQFRQNKNYVDESLDFSSIQQDLNNIEKLSSSLEYLPTKPLVYLDPEMN